MNLSPRLDPALFIEVIKVGLIMLVSFGLPLSTDQQNTLVLLAVAVAGVLKAWKTRPMAVTVFTDLIQAAGVAAMAFGTPLGQDQLATIVAFVSAVMVLIQRNQISPADVNGVAYNPDGSAAA